MQKTTATVAPSSTAHHQRVRAIVRRLVIELGYLERCQRNGDRDLNLQIAIAGIDAAIDDLNEYLETNAQKIAPTTEASAERDDMTAVYPLTTHED